MKQLTAAALLVVFHAILAGCASPSSTTRRDEQFRKQLEQTVPVKDYGYTVQDLRFSADSKKALVVFGNPDRDPRVRPNWEFVLTADEFRRYRGASMQPFDTPGTANTPVIQILVTLPPN